VVVDGDREDLLGAVLADDVLVEEALISCGLRERRDPRGRRRRFSTSSAMMSLQRAMHSSQM
jgi:hypothetical protein